MAEIARKKKNAGIGRLAGGIGLPALTALGVTLMSGGTLGPMAMGALAGVGSRVGSELGEHSRKGAKGLDALFGGGGGDIEDMSLKQEGYTFGAQNLADKRAAVDQETADFGMQQWLQSGTDAMTGYASGISAGKLLDMKVGGKAINYPGFVENYLSTIAGK